jgi:hypothetical protein
MRRSRFTFLLCSLPLALLLGLSLWLISPGSGTINKATLRKIAIGMKKHEVDALLMRSPTCIRVPRSETEVWYGLYDDGIQLMPGSTIYVKFDREGQVSGNA